MLRILPGHTVHVKARVTRVLEEGWFRASTALNMDEHLFHATDVVYQNPKPLEIGDHVETILPHRTEINGVIRAIDEEDNIAWVKWFPSGAHQNELLENLKRRPLQLSTPRRSTPLQEP